MGIQAKAGGMMPQKHANPNTKTLNIFVFIILLIGTVVGVLIYYSAPLDHHWMEGPSIAVMVAFMPLTAISYLHFRLPRKRDEFDNIVEALGARNYSSEVSNVMFEQSDVQSDYLLPVGFVTVFCTLGFYILLVKNGNVLFTGTAWIADASDLYRDAISESKEYRRGVVAIGMAFLGAYIWSIQYIFRRMITLDLPPGAFYSVGSRMVYSSFLAVILQHFIVKAGMDLVSNQLVAISFLIGIFPDRALAFMKEKLGKMFKRPNLATQALPLEMLEGINAFHKARLVELGIDNVQNLAQASLLELILKTPFKPRVLIDWMAQARLCLEFKSNSEAIRSAGVRTILDFQETCEQSDLIAVLASSSGLSEDLIRTVYNNNKDEVSITRLRDAYDRLNVI